MTRHLIKKKEADQERNLVADGTPRAKNLRHKSTWAHGNDTKGTVSRDLLCFLEHLRHLEQLSRELLEHLAL